MMSLRQEALKLYRQILRLSRKWESPLRSPEETEAERRYIADEAKKLFKKNKHVSSIKLLKIWIPEKNIVIILKFELIWVFHRVMHPQDANGMANSVDPFQSSLIWVYTVCSNLSV